MIVYGDPSYEAGFAVLLARLRERVETALRSGDASTISLDTLRGLLIFAGQIEQAAWDDLPALVDSESSAAFLSLTKHTTYELAGAYIAAWNESANSPSPAISSNARSLLYGVRAMLDGAILHPFPAPSNVQVRVKLPEGFAFYALYPEQYAQAAELWGVQPTLDPEPRIVVVGIRSIGTTLSALISRLLYNAGRQAHNVTARPGGHPFARSVEGGLQGVDGADYALIVDEGPGMSGSSMAAIAQALVQSGIQAERIAFLPGHGGEPGGQGNDDVKCWWATTPRYVTPSQDMRWNGLTLTHVLAAQTIGLVGSRHSVAEAHVENFGGGLWRRSVYVDKADWPAANAAFEMPKYRISLPDGTRVLWKFAGLATDADGVDQAEAAYQILTQRGKAGWTPAPLGTAMGFVAMPWIEAAPLTFADATPDTLKHIGHYIASVAAAPLSLSEHNDALTRLADMLYWNTWEALGEEHAVRTRVWSDLALNASWLQSAPAYGDGRLTPHEWLRLPDRTLLKSDAAGHDADHTVVGRQCWLWDIAGTITEWRLEEAQADTLLHAAQESITGKAQGQQAVTPNVVIFYRMAYAAFRVGQTHLCAQMSGHDLEEQARLWQAYSVYREQLHTLLAAVP